MPSGLDLQLSAELRAKNYSKGRMPVDTSVQSRGTELRTSVIFADTCDKPYSLANMTFVALTRT